mmetsp:Transcript_13122/g.15281  ORF Transcript_13122/g.15281 Transcript_13122/m.15281 type:complete len:785 (+) Transcript_13122:341-2695(+)
MATQVATDNSVIDTDMQSDVGEGFQTRIETLMLSPTILTKRLNQAINAIEQCHWQQVSYLISANPWLAEMPDIRSDQYLLHKLAFHGSSIDEPAPVPLNEEMINTCPASIHKFDKDGNLPLHCAAVAGNADMLIRLSELFPGGASVKNNNGYLPLHMSVQACSEANDTESEYSALGLVKIVLNLFPEGLAIADNEGNTPLHLASSELQGSVGAEVIDLFVKEADQLGDRLRFASSVRAMQAIDESECNVELVMDEVDESDDCNSILLARNSMQWTPLMTAVKKRAGWKVLDSILCCRNVKQIMFDTDENGRNILQLTLEECYDPPSTLSILKYLPQLVTIRNIENGALPIEIACIQGLQPEVIMAITLLDLPIDLDTNDRQGSRKREGYGGSWWYLNCECDDAHPNIVKEILEICDYQQKRDLCFTKNDKGRTLIKRATPKCKNELRKALRFVGRYEFVGSAVAHAENGSKVFEALDFGTDDDPIVDGQKVLLQYYGNEESYNEAFSVLQKVDIEDSTLVPMRFFQVNKSESTNKAQNQYCIAVDSPSGITLSRIVSNMNSDRYQNDNDRLSRYISKLCKVFQMIAEGLHLLHQQGVVHGHIHAGACGKFDDGWKLMDLIGSQFIGKDLSIYRMDTSAPPELVRFEGRSKKPMVDEIVFARASIDVWGFGKLMFEVLTGKDLLPVDSHKMVDEDEAFLRRLGSWDEDDLSNVVAEVEASGAGTLAADLVTHCLCPLPEHRPKSLKEVLAHPYWNDSKLARRSSSGGRMTRVNSFSSVKKRRGHT